MTTGALAIPSFMNICLFMCYLSLCLPGRLLALHNFMRLTRKQWVQPARSLSTTSTQTPGKKRANRKNQFIYCYCLHSCNRLKVFALCIHCIRLAKNAQIFVLSAAKAINLYCFSLAAFDVVCHHRFGSSSIFAKFIAARLQSKHFKIELSSLIMLRCPFSYNRC